MNHIYTHISLWEQIINKLIPGSVMTLWRAPDWQIPALFLLVWSSAQSCFPVAALNPLLPPLAFYLQSNMKHTECRWFSGPRARQQYLSPTASHPQRLNNSDEAEKTGKSQSLSWDHKQLDKHILSAALFCECMCYHQSTKCMSASVWRFCSCIKNQDTWTHSWRAGSS